MPLKKGTISMRSSSHSPDRISVTFDDDHAVANAGLIQPATLADHLGLRELFDEYVHLGAGPGHANVGLKATTPIYSALAGGDCIEDADRMRVAATTEVLGHGVRAPSTLGTFLRSFTWGHVAQLDRVLDESIRRSWAAGAGPGQGPVTLDVDSTICETYGPKEQGSRFGYTSRRGYHPLLGTVAGTEEVVGVRRRGGNANTGRGSWLSHPGVQPCAPGGGNRADGAQSRLGLLQLQGDRSLRQSGGELLGHGQDLQGIAQGDRQMSFGGSGLSSTRIVAASTGPMPHWRQST
jgi:hypothetical protein